MYEERLCVWPISGDRWIMVSPDGTLMDVRVHHLVALLDVTGKQTFPRVAEQIDQSELPVSDGEFLTYFAALISSRENLPESNYKPDSGFRLGGPDFVISRWFHALRFSPDRGKNDSCSGGCLRSAASHGASG